MPKIHSKFNDQKLHEALMNKATAFLSTPKGDTPSFIFLSGQFFDVKGFAYSALRAWKGAAKPTDSGRSPTLEATFASLSVYLSSLLSLQSDFYFAYDEIKEILAEKNRDDSSDNSAGKLSVAITTTPLPFMPRKAFCSIGS